MRKLVCYASHYGKRVCVDINNFTVHKYLFWQIDKSVSEGNFSVMPLTMERLCVDINNFTVHKDLFWQFDKSVSGGDLSSFVC